MGVDFYACGDCGETFPDCGSYYSCEQCYRHYCSTECAALTPITPFVSTEDEDAEDHYYNENELQCGICSKATPDYYLIYKSLLKHFKITKEDALQIWRDDKDEEK